MLLLRIFFVGVLFAAIASADKKDAEFWINHFGMISMGAGLPYMSNLITYGNLTRDLPPGYLLGETRFTGSDNYVLFKSGSKLFPFYKYPGIDILHHVRGGSLRIYIIDPATGDLTVKSIGSKTKDDGFTVVIPPGQYAAWKLITRKHKPEDFSLVAVTSIPEFRPGDESGLNRKFLLDEFPQHTKLINSLTFHPK